MQAQETAKKKAGEPGLSFDPRKGEDFSAEVDMNICFSVRA